MEGFGAGGDETSTAGGVTVLVETVVDGDGITGADGVMIWMWSNRTL